MKLNGKNIITDKDITITGASSLGDNLSDILIEQQNTLNNLKSNVKWLYKYGGVGSGGGSGSSNKNWDLFATIGGRVIVDNTTLSLSSTDSSSANITYVLSLSIKNGSGVYSVRYSYDFDENGSNPRSGSVVLDVNNGWNTSISITLSKNSYITLIATDNSDIKSITADYVITPYKFENIVLVNDAGNIYPSYENDVDVLIGNAYEKGLVAKINYSVAVQASVSYYWEYLGNKTEVKILDLTQKTGSILEKLPQEFLIDENAGLYDIKCFISITPLNQEEEKIEKSLNFNLIPGNLYLKVSPVIGTLYNQITSVSPESNIYSYKTNSVISINTRFYWGVSQGRDGELVCSIFDLTNNGDIVTDGSSISGDWTEIITGEENKTYLREDNTKTIQISFSEPGWKKIKFELTVRGNTTTQEKYIYLIQTSTNYNWYKEIISTEKQSYFRFNTTSNPEFDDFYKLNSNNAPYYQMFTSSDILTLTKVNNTEPKDILIHVGIQYNEINNDNNPIISFYTYAEDESYISEYIKIYQNKINISGTDVEIFLNKESNFNPTIPSKYQLVTIASSYIKSDAAAGIDYRQCCIYINGILVGAAKSWLSNSTTLGKIELLPGNYSINLLEVLSTNNISRPINDVDVSYYYYTYKIKSNSIDTNLDENLTKIIESLYGANNEMLYSIENKQLKLASSGIITTISKNLSIPTLVLSTSKYLTEYDSSGKTTIFNWLNATNSSEDTTGIFGIKCPVTLFWYSGNENSNEEGVGIDFGKPISGASFSEGDNISFYIKLQGSSTLRFKSKNFTLGVESTDKDSTITPLFSPNYKGGDPSTFLPDTEFTLKADVVDSSHSNNTSIGKFINHHAKVSYGSQYVGSTDPLGSHIKLCLEGFPIIIFLEVIGDESKGETNEYYYLGIYNFNLGRGNLFNLGYKDLNLLRKEDGITPKLINADRNTFTTTTISSTETSLLDGFIVGEVQGNSPLFDFSQYDASVLFPLEGTTEKSDYGYMFGDINYGNDVSTVYKGRIINFVRNVSAAGNFIFNRIGKNFAPAVDENGNVRSLIGYKTENTVPDADIQYARNPDHTYRIQDKIEQKNPTRDDINNFNIGLVNSCINKDEEETDNIKASPYLDYTSVVYYYTICMAFGLVDSVQKNLNIKTWNGKTFGTYFYDMDTSLGINNDGNSSSYFCFSDYWKSKFVEETDKEGNTVIVNQGAEIFRDYYPEKNVPNGYDTPSSYLFAIAKYVSTTGALGIQSDLLGGESLDSTGGYNSPQKIWGDWRKKGGILETSDKFIDEYFKDHLDKVPETLLNLNYRLKYLYYDLNDTSDNQYQFSETELKVLKGRRVDRTRDWIKSRFYILDAYFNLSKENNAIISKEIDGNSYSCLESVTPISNLNENEDIIILQDIFTPLGDTVTRNGLVECLVKAKDYTPLIVQVATTKKRYLLEKENTEYKIKTSFATQSSKFGGSARWTYLDKIDSFITTRDDNNFYLSSKLLEYIVGTEGTLSGSNTTFNIPAVRQMTLISPEYSFDLNINESFTNLSDLSISGTGIKLRAENSNLTELNASNLKKPKTITSEYSLELINNKNLKTVNLEGSSFDRCNFTPIWTDASEYIDLSKLGVTTLNIEGRGGELVIKSSSTITNLIFSGFKKITISSCPNLKDIICNDTSSRIEEVVVTDCININAITIIANKLKILNLEDCIKLTTVDLRKIDVTSNDIELASLETLKLKNTKISKIIRSFKDNNSWVELENRVDDNMLYLTDFPNLNTKNGFSIYNNPSVQFIKVRNEESNPFKVYGDGFSGCEKLERVFGNVEINSSKCFQNSSLFSIHGYYIDSNGSISLYKNNSTVKYNGVSVVDTKTGKIHHPLELGNNVVEKFDDTHYKMKFQEGENVTNISIGNSGSLNYAFSNTSCTIFDIYYIFQNLNNASEELDAMNCFSIISKNISGPAINFSWTSTVDNSPNRYMFKDWGWKLRNISGLFQGGRATGTTLRIFSTYLNEGNETIGGLFYYTPNITNLSLLFYPASNTNYVTDNNILTTTGNGFENLTSIDYFNPKNFVKDINTVDYSELFNSNGDLNKDYIFDENGVLRLGDVSGLFKHCPNLTKLNNVISNLDYINYTTADNLQLPPSVKYIYNSLRTRYATGELRFENIFKALDSDSSSYSLEEICQSFVVSYSFEDQISSLGLTSTNYEDAKMVLTDEMFTNFSNITNIGFKSNIDASIIDSSGSSFGGYLKKIINGNEFPYNIISKLTKLKTFTGFFRNLDIVDNFDKINLPGNLFENNINLENVSRCFQDIRAKNITLTPESFSNCTKLVDVSYLFCNTQIINDNYENSFLSGEKLGIISSIPAKMFYHGHKIESDKLFKGSNSIKYIEIQEDGWIADVNNLSVTHITEESVDKTIHTIYSNIIFVYSTEDDTIITGFNITPVSKITTVEYLNGSEISNNEDWAGNVEFNIEEKVLSGIISVNKTIVSMQNCFQGQGWINHYELDTDTISNYSDYVEPNPNYQPFKYIYNEKTNSWVDKTSTYDEKKYTYMWNYDGKHRPPTEYHYIDEDINLVDSASNSIIPPGRTEATEQCVTNFFCAPDLFRYCTTAPNITNIFNYAGYTEQYGIVDDLTGELNKVTSYGITGRICPYLLMPISSITSLEGFISYAPRLSYYTLNEVDSEGKDIIYVIPKTFFSYATKITNLTSAFKGLVLPNGCKLNVFDYLKNNSLNVDYTFQYSYYHGTSENKFKVTEVFINNKISSAKATFSIGDGKDDPPTGSRRLPGQYIYFGINFTATNLPRETSSSNYKVRNVYDGYLESTVEFEGKNTTKEFRAESPYNYRTRQ